MTTRETGDYLPFNPAPHAPREPLPEGACDCHFHVFEDPARHPFGPARGYTPSIATWADYRSMADTLGLDRAVLVHPSVYGADHASFEDLLRAEPQRLRGVAVARADTPDADIARWHALGARGTRFNVLSRGGADLASLPVVADKVRPFGWHLQLLIDVNRTPEALAHAMRPGLTVVVDHLGHVPAASALAGAGYRDLLARVREGAVWVKLSGAYRVTTRAHDFADVRPLWDALVAANPARLVWGTDWPHPDIAPPMPDDGDLADLLVDWLTPALRQQILVDNPTRLYWAT